jgi:hypothetical protein
MGLESVSASLSDVLACPINLLESAAGTFIHPHEIHGWSFIMPQSHAYLVSP